jgi:subtilisin family serine protease
MSTVQPWARVPSESGQSDPKFSNAWYFNNTGQNIDNVSGPGTGKAGADINATDAWDLTAGSNSVVIVVFDSGVDLSNSDLAGNLWTNPNDVADGIDNDGNGFVDDVRGWNFIDDNNNINDTFGHGTTVNSVIGSVGNNGTGLTGVAWNVKLLNVKVGDVAGVDSADLSAAVDYVIGLKQRGVNIAAINASYFGLSGLSDFATVEKAGDAGILYVAAAGNAPFNLDIIPSSFLPTNLIFVAASDARDNLASFTAYGKNNVKLAAPGVDILTYIPGGLIVPASGTSYAAPMVSGTLALMKSLVPGATNDMMTAALFAGADRTAATVGKTKYGRLNTYKSLQVLIGARKPVGTIDSASGTQVVGWAFDPNAGHKPVMVQLLIDGVPRATKLANLNRPGLSAALGSPNHGYSFDVPALSPGQHNVVVRAIDFDPYRTPKAPTILGTQTISFAAAPVGRIDGLTLTRVKGWTVDTDSPSTSLTVRVDVDGSSIGTFPANLSRPGLVPIYGSANHGFFVNLPSLPTGFHRVDVYALDTDTSVFKLIASQTLGGNVAATGDFESFDGTTLTGWAGDPNTPLSAIKVLYKIDNGAPTLVDANVNRPDIAGTWGSSNHGFSITVPQLTVGSHTAEVWAIDADTGELTSLGTQTVVVSNPSGRTLPRGAFVVSATGLVQGWAFDFNAGASPIQVRIDVDGVQGIPFNAGLNRPVLTPIVGSPNHGFSQKLTLTPGAHVISVYVIGDPNDEEILLGTRVVGQKASLGRIDGITASTIRGWAFNETAGANPVLVRVDIDGIAGPIITANLQRIGLISAVGSPNHGFSMPTPSNLAPGIHSLRLVVIDPTTLIGTTVFTGSLTTT